MTKWADIFRIVFSFACIIEDDLNDAALLLPPPLLPIFCQTTCLQININRLSELSVMTECLALIIEPYKFTVGTLRSARPVHCSCHAPADTDCISMIGHLEIKVVPLILISIASLFSLGLNQSGNGHRCLAALCRDNCIGTSKWGKKWDPVSDFSMVCACNRTC